MKVNQVLLWLSIIIFTVSGCSSFSVGNRGGTIKVETKAKQPSVIVNTQVKDSGKA
ncbi:hypothetical protein H4J59_18995 [Colwellia sp. MB02u-10]|jgi:hypothetical protein|uniref:hypothetical protein n=1 Tax=Colwellia sp. MB02u-10 TaxID=2759828 RepID=UPI0015F4EDEC|nr:hypothetical protein [Colwellia sp. MB02u-10]MBA6343081.1 hypothetical protein [Colwellia sp. MB02u-10]